MQLKVLVANVALGIPGSDSPIRGLSSLVRFHGWRIFPFLLTEGRFGNIFDYSARPSKGRVSYFSAHSTVRPILALIEKEKPDVVVLSEILLQIHQEPLEAGLRKLGIAHIAWGPSLHHPDVTVATVVASRLACLENYPPPSMFQLPQISGGAGIAGLRLRDYPITVIGSHLTVGLRELSRRQVEDLVRIYESEREQGRTTILAGDFNERAEYLNHVPSFKALGLSTVTKKPTTPVGFPRFLQVDYDHIFLPPGWRASETHYRSFGSDHLAVVSELCEPLAIRQTPTRILTINTAFGFAGMDRFTTNLKHHLHMHGWGALTYEFFPSLRGKSSLISEEKRVAYVKKNQHLEPYLELIRRVAPDILVLNEALYELYHERLNRELRAMGFRTIAWGLSEHYPGTTISIVIATKEPGEAIPCAMPQRPGMGGGAGMAGIRLKGRSLSIFGVHLTYRNPAMFVKQLAYIAEMTKKERALGNEVILAGDWNENEAALYANPDFKALGLVSADPNEKLTCPTFFPRFLQKALDHIFIPTHWTRDRAETLPSGSDHLALCVEVNP